MPLGYTLHVILVMALGSQVCCGRLTSKVHTLENLASI